MRWLSGWLRGGSGEVGWDDLVRRIVDAVATLAHYAERGRKAFPPDVLVRVEVAESSVDVARGFVEDARFDDAVGAALANAADCDETELPRREYEVVAAPRLRVQVKAGSPRAWAFEIQGGDRDGETTTLPVGRREIRLGRGEWHGAEQSFRNDITVCHETSFVSRRAARLAPAGHHLEVESLDQGDALVVHREAGNAVRPARTARGRVAIGAGDVIELIGGLDDAESVRLTVRRVIVGEDDGRADG